MSHSDEISEFLRTRRDRISPQQAGLVAGGRRRVPGLRREEVALLAGLSVDYYAKMERGDLRGVSPEVLVSLAEALRLDEAETDHLHDLAAAANRVPPRRRGAPAAPSVRPELLLFLDAVTGAPVWVSDETSTMVAANDLARALYSPLLDDPSNQQNTARFIFLNPASRVFFPDWDQVARNSVASLRQVAGRNPHDKAITNLIGELVTRSDTFRHEWAAHDVRHHREGTKWINHPEVGVLELSYLALDLPATPRWHGFAYTAPVGSPSAEKLQLLASLAATPTARTKENIHE